MTQSQLAADVVDELEWDPGVDGNVVKVTEVDGVVVLAGHAPSYLHKLNATKAAMRATAIGTVRNELKIDMPDRLLRTDGELVRHIASRFEWYNELPTEKVTVTVENGRVILTGEVPRHFQREEIEDFIGRIGGVRDIENALTLSRKADASNIEDRIKQAFRRGAVRDAGQIEVEAKNGKIALTGSVHAPYERGLARRAAWSAPGVHSAVDRLHSLGDAPSPPSSSGRI